MTDYKSRKLLVDKERAPYIENAFKLYATGNHTMHSLADKLYDDGFRSITGKKVHHSTIDTILKNPIYYGYFNWKGELHKGIHERIISKNLFDEVTKILAPKKHLKRDNKKYFLFRGFMHCVCGLRMTAENKIKKNGLNIHKYIYYRCTKSRGVAKCCQQYLREEELTTEICQSLKQIRIDEEFLDLVIEGTRARSQGQFENLQVIEEKNSFLLERNKSRQKMLVGKYIDGKIPEDIYDRTLEELRSEQATLENKVENVSGDNSKNVFEIIEAIASFMKIASAVFKDGTDEIKKEVLSLISSNLIIEDKKIVEFTLKEPFNWLYEDLKNLKNPKGGNGIFEPIIRLSQKEKGACAPFYPEMLGIRDSNPSRSLDKKC